MAKINQAIPFCLRANREARAQDMKWVSTPQGPVLEAIEARMTIIARENGFEHVDSAIAELTTIIDRIKALRQASLQINVVPHHLNAEAKKLQDLVAAHKNWRKERADAAQQKLDTILTKVKSSKVEVQADDESSVLLVALKNYIQTGDITHIVPNGGFESTEEAELWKRVTMVHISAIDGRTLTLTRMSNKKEPSANVLMPGLSADIGKAAVLDNGKKMILAVVPLPADRADKLARTFNSLYRR